MTWILATGFVITSISLTILAARNANSDSVLQRLGAGTNEESQGQMPAPAGLEGNLLPPTPDNAPAAPPTAE